MLYLIDYDRKSGILAPLRTFDDLQRDAASKARVELEIDLRRRGLDHEVVILEAESLDDIKKTHRRYFATLDELGKMTIASDE